MYQGANKTVVGSADELTPITSGTSRAPKEGAKNSIYEQLNPDGTVKSRTFYDEGGKPFSRQDFDHEHYIKELDNYYQPHEHNYQYNENGYPNGKYEVPLPDGYYNIPTLK
jgi:hypothetical protein